MPVTHNIRSDGSGVEKSGTEAKQGVELHRMRYVLAGGMIGTVLAFLVAYLIVTH